MGDIKIKEYFLNWVKPDHYASCNVITESPVTLAPGLLYFFFSLLAWLHSCCRIRKQSEQENHPRHDFPLELKRGRLSLTTPKTALLEYDLVVMKSASTMYMEEIIRRTSAVKMYKRDMQSFRKTLSDNKYLKYKQGYQDFKRDASNVISKGKSIFNHEIG